MAINRYIEVNATIQLNNVIASAHIDENMPLGALNVHNYNKLINKPRINGVELVGDKSLQDLGIFQEIQRQVTAHNEDKEAHIGFYEWRGIVKTENDLPTKDMRSGDVYHIIEPSSFGMEGSNVVWYADETKDSGGYWDYLGQDTLTDYAKYQEVLDVLNAAIEIDVGNIGHVDTLPEKGTPGIIYLVEHKHNDKDQYDEYVWNVDRYELIGNTDIDLSEYTKKTDVAAIDKRVNTLENLVKNADFIKQITTDDYKDLTGVVSQKGTIYFIEDYKVDDNGDKTGAFLVGDGNAYIGDLPVSICISKTEQELLNRLSEKVGCKIDASNPERLVFYY